MALEPLWKYLGGKRALVKPVIAALGSGWIRYVEPCVGAGAVALAMPEGTRMVLADVDAPLVRLWRRVQTAPEALALEVAALTAEPMTAARHRALREREIRGSEAALLVAIQASFNGLYRRGRFGLLNAPWNHRAEVSVPGTLDLVEVAAHLRRAEILHRDAVELLEDCGRGDAVYLDPPYVGTQAYSGGRPWRWDDLDPMIAAAERAAGRGARVVLSHADAPALRARLRGWALTEVEARRPVNRDGAGRGAVGEVVARIG